MAAVESQIYNTASEILETNRIPDPYTYSLNSQGKLVLAYTGQVVEDNIETFTPLGKAELEGLQNLQLWFRKNNYGSMAWLSLPYQDVYESTKIIVSEIIEVSGMKILFNRAMVLDELSATDALLYARDLKGELLSADELRRNPIEINEDADWLEVLSHYIDISEVNEFIKSGRDKVEKENAIDKARKFQQKIKAQGLYKMQLSVSESIMYNELLGTNPLRCAARQQTSFQSIFEKSLYIGEKQILCCTCPFCGKRVEAEIYNGEIHCPRKECGKRAPYRNS